MTSSGSTAISPRPSLRSTKPIFTGLITHLGTIVERRPFLGGERMIVECADIAKSSKPGDSICVSGVCLTLVSTKGAYLNFDVVPETLSRSNLGALATGDWVNLEPSLRVGDPLGGHFVYGHVDATTPILTRQPEGPGYRIRCGMPPGLATTIVEKGFVALDGVSLTVAGAQTDAFEIALVPETLKRTSFGRKMAGASVNVEVDPVARYVAAIVANRK